MQMNPRMALQPPLYQRALVGAGVVDNQVEGQGRRRLHARAEGHLLGVFPDPTRSFNRFSWFASIQRVGAGVNMATYYTPHGSIV